MPTFDNPFVPDLGFRRSGCCCGEHASEFEHEKGLALEASRQARRRLIAETLRGLFRPASAEQAENAPPLALAHLRS